MRIHQLIIIYNKPYINTYQQLLLLHVTEKWLFFNFKNARIWKRLRKSTCKCLLSIDRLHTFVKAIFHSYNWYCRWWSGQVTSWTLYNLYALVNRQMWVELKICFSLSFSIFSLYIYIFIHFNFMWRNITSNNSWIEDLF